MSHMLENQLFAAAQVIEQQLDQEFDRLDNLDTEDLKALREKRIQEMKKLNNKKQEWLRNVRTSIIFIYDISFHLTSSILSRTGSWHLFRTGRREGVLWGI